MRRSCTLGLAVLLPLACDAQPQAAAKQDPPASEAKAPDAGAPGEAAPTDPKTPTDAKIPAAKVEPIAEPEPPADTKPPAEPPPSPFEAHVQSLLDAAKPQLGENPGKDAFAHYKAGDHDEAIPLFGAAALARPTEWKPAFNMACSAALHGDEQTARIALAEAIRRDRSVIEKAKQDNDLVSVRGEAWFAELTEQRQPDDDTPDPEPVAEEASEDEADAFSRTWFGKHCNELEWDEPPKKLDRRCWDDYLVGAFDFKTIAFDTPLELDLPDPGTMPRKRWRRISKKMDTKKTVAALGVRAGYGLDPETCQASRALILDPFECPFYRPGFWWPTDDEVFVVIPHNERRSPATARTITLARKVGETWMGAKIDIVIDPDHLSSGSMVFESGPLLRPDGLEFWVWGELFDTADEMIEDLHLCRIGWYEGELRQACARDWSTQWTFAHPEITEMTRE